MPRKYAPDILIVEDEQAVMRLFRSLLEEDGYVVSCATTLRAASNFLDDRVFDAIILDTSLPDGDSLDLIRVVRERHPFTKILSISGYMSAEAVERAAKAAGAHATAVKPLAPRSFINSVYRLLDPSCSWTAEAAIANRE
jgi:DNA-binding NtrC family response regulator